MPDSWQVMLVAVLLIWPATKLYDRWQRTQEVKESEPIPSPDVVAVFRKSESLQVYACKHSGPETFSIWIYGQEQQYSSAPQADPLSLVTYTTKCPECLLRSSEQYIRRCAVCGGPILAGDNVSLHKTAEEGLRLDISTEVAPMQVLGCAKQECWQGANLHVGIWDGEKVVPSYGGGTYKETLPAFLATAIT
jgi:hypothetical protein